MESSGELVVLLNRQGGIAGASKGARAAMQPTLKLPSENRGEGRWHSGTEEHIFALEHFHGQEKRHTGIDASGQENDSDEIPVVRAGD
jgi:hypothetical protein